MWDSKPQLTSSGIRDAPLDLLGERLDQGLTAEFWVTQSSVRVPSSAGLNVATRRSDVPGTSVCSAESAAVPSCAFVTVRCCPCVSIVLADLSRVVDDPTAIVGCGSRTAGSTVACSLSKSPIEIVGGAVNIAVLRQLLISGRPVEFLVLPSSPRGRGRFRLAGRIGGCTRGAAARPAAIPTTAAGQRQRDSRAQQGGAPTRPPRNPQLTLGFTLHISGGGDPGTATGRAASPRRRARRAH